MLHSATSETLVLKGVRLDLDSISTRDTTSKVLVRLESSLLYKLICRVELDLKLKL